MAELKVGDSLPDGVTFTYVPYSPAHADITACGMLTTYNASKGMQNLDITFNLLA
jgi:alkyl hydroperoxide reductase 1